MAIGEVSMNGNLLARYVLQSNFEWTATPGSPHQLGTLQAYDKMVDVSTEPLQNFEYLRPYIYPFYGNIHYWFLDSKGTQSCHKLII
jgi:hypothetical protein